MTSVRLSFRLGKNGEMLVDLVPNEFGGAGIDPHSGNDSGFHLDITPFGKSRNIGAEFEVRASGVDGADAHKLDDGQRNVERIDGLDHGFGHYIPPTGQMSVGHWSSANQQSSVSAVCESNQQSLTGFSESRAQ